MTPTPAPEDNGVTIHETIREVPLTRPGAGRLDVTLTMPSLARFAEDPLRRLDVTGTISLAELPGIHTVTGTFQLFPPGKDYLMRYDLIAVDRDERIWSLTGIKNQIGGGPLARYRASTRVVLDAQAADGSAAFRTHLRILPRDVIRNGASIRGTGFISLRRCWALFCFAVVFAHGLLARQVSHLMKGIHMDAATRRLADDWVALWNGDLTQTRRIVAEGFVAYAAPLMGGVPGATAPAGGAVEFFGTDTLRIDDDRLIAEYWANADSLWFAQQIGLAAGATHSTRR